MCGCLKKGLSAKLGNRYSYCVIIYLLGTLCQDFCNNKKTEVNVIFYFILQCS